MDCSGCPGRSIDSYRPMQTFEGPGTNTGLWFHNLCAADGTQIAYDPVDGTFTTAAPFCSNREQIGCNWVAPEPGRLCSSCAMTAMVPDKSVENAQSNWAQTEAAKRWVLENLGHWGWFGSEDSGVKPMFHLLAEGPTPVSMGHIEGVVTISVAEADDVIRTTRRRALDEPYRSLIGHVRHEIAHMIWWRLSQNEEFLDTFRVLFGDERSDYSQALQRHYDVGPPLDWREHYLTAYASAHPHEDWAETAASLMHLTDIADSFVASGFCAPNVPGDDWQPYAETDSERLIRAAVSIALGVNHINRSMGLPDLYPFVICPSARRKLSFAHHWLRTGAAVS